MNQRLWHSTGQIIELRGFTQQCASTKGHNAQGLDSETIFLIPVSQAAHAKYIQGIVAIHKRDHVIPTTISLG